MPEFYMIIAQNYFSRFFFWGGRGTCPLPSPRLLYAYNPYVHRDCSELGLKRFTVLDNRPTLADMENKFRRTKLIACVGSIVLTLAMIPMWPLITLADGVMDLQAFTRWVCPP